MIAPTLIRMERARFCFAGAMAAPAGLEAATPVVSIDSAAAVPTGSCVPFEDDCCPSDCGVWARACKRAEPGLSGRVAGSDGAPFMFVARLLELRGGSLSDEVVFVDWLALLSCCCAIAPNAVVLNEGNDTKTTQVTTSRVSPNILMILSRARSLFRPLCGSPGDLRIPV